MRTPPRILAVDDIPANLEILRVRLESRGYDVVLAADGEEALVRFAEVEPDLVLLDIMMPGLDGLSVLRRIKQDASRFTPVILVTAKADTRDVVAGLEAGGDDYLTKPFEHAALMARVRSLLRAKELHDQVREQAARLKEQAGQLTEWNARLEERVSEQKTKLERVDRLQRFLPPQIAELIASSETLEAALQSHRRLITVLFCDLRGFTTFTDTSDPEEVMGVLREYHECVGRLVQHYEGTLERFLGDGVMIVFNDPIPCADHCERAVRLAIDMRDGVGALSAKWRTEGHNVGFGVGVATGYATMGLIGFDKRRDYTAIGRVTNMAARLCDRAKAGQIIVSQRTFTAVEDRVRSEPLGEASLKGFNNPAPIFAIVSWGADDA